MSEDNSELLAKAMQDDDNILVQHIKSLYSKINELNSGRNICIDLAKRREAEIKELNKQNNRQEWIIAALVNQLKKHETDKP